MKLICYLSNGYPTISQSAEMAAHYVQAGCDVIEVDLPSSNPYLEGALIAGRMKTALATCSDYDQYLDNIRTIHATYPGIEVLLLAYEQTILEIGVERFIAYCLDNDLKDLIVVGHEKESVRPRLIENGLRVSCYVQFHMPDDEIASALDSNGFVYMQAKPTSGPVNPDYPTLKACIRKLRDLGISRPIHCGVGVYTADDVQMVREAGGDGVFVGSSILKHEQDYAQVEETIRTFKAATL